jgi:ABC-type branched-subunit amino acid transport system substrate-binding protein
MPQNDSPIEKDSLPDDTSPADTQNLPAHSADKKDAVPNPGKFKSEQIFVFVLFIILLIFFNANPFIFSTLTGLLTLLTVGSLENVSNKLIEFIGKPVNWLKKPFDRLFSAIFTSPKALKKHRSLIINIVISIIIAVTLATTTLHGFLIDSAGDINDYFCLRQSTVPWATCNSGLGTTTLADGVKIGLIEDESYGYFDQSSLNSEEKTVDDLIFHENQTACHEPQHTTLAIVTMLSRTVEDPAADADLGLEDLRGAYLAQHNYNAKKPSMLLCLVIANLGTSDTANQKSLLVKSHPNSYSLQLVIHRLEQFTRSDANFRGIIGFPFSQQAIDAMQTITNSPQLKSIPVISPSASADLLSNIPNFYRMVSPDKSQGQVLADFFCQHLVKNQPPNVAIFTYNDDAYSRSLLFAFENQTPCLAKDSLVLIPYQNGNVNSIKKAANQALKDHNAKYLFFPGYNSDLDTLQLAIRDNMQDKSNTITIIGGDGLYDIDGTATHNYYSPVYSTTFASLSTNTFASDYMQQGFSKPYLANSIPGYTLLAPHVILTNDATTAFITALQLMTGTNFSQNTFNAELATITFNGVSGTIQLRGDQNDAHSSDRNGGNIYVTCTDPLHNNSIHLIAKYQSSNTEPITVKEGSLTNKPSLC